MAAFSCNVRVISVNGLDEGAVAALSYVDGGGIDIDPQSFDCNFTSEVAQEFKVGDVLQMTLASADPLPSARETAHSRIEREIEEKANQRTEDMGELQKSFS